MWDFVCINKMSKSDEITGEISKILSKLGVGVASQKRADGVTIFSCIDKEIGHGYGRELSTILEPDAYYISDGFIFRKPENIIAFLECYGLNGGFGKRLRQHNSHLTENVFFVRLNNTWISLFRVRETITDSELIDKPTEFECVINYTSEQAKLAVQLDGDLIRNIRHDMITCELLQLACKQRGAAIRHIREYLNDTHAECCAKECREYAIHNNPFSIRHMWGISLDLYRLAINLDCRTYIYFTATVQKMLESEYEVLKERQMQRTIAWMRSVDTPVDIKAKEAKYRDWKRHKSALEVWCREQHIDIERSDMAKCAKLREYLVAGNEMPSADVLITSWIFRRQDTEACHNHAFSKFAHT